MRTDPITLQILRNFARATAESMATTSEVATTRRW